MMEPSSPPPPTSVALLDALSYLLKTSFVFCGSDDDGALSFGKQLTRHPTLATGGGGGGGGTNTTDDANNNTVAKVLDAGKDALRRLQRRRLDLSFSKDALVADATANYRSKIGQPLVQRLPAKTPATIERFIVDPFSFYREVCVVSILIYFARQTVTAKRRRHRQRKERIKRSILKRMSKCETYAKYVTLEEELEKFEEDEDEEIAIVYCSSDKRGLKGAKERFGSSLNGFLD